QKLVQRYSQIAQRVACKIQRPVVLSLTALRKDTDHDGLPDVAEARLGLDPAKADTDGDGIPDGKDANPLARPNPAPSDRERLLQAVFSALYGGDPADAEATILRKDGPCLFNDDHTKAEVHIWQWRRRSAQPYGGWRGMQSNDLPVDTLARFERHGEWKLISLKPWRFDSADRAM